MCIYEICIYSNMLFVCMGLKMGFMLDNGFGDGNGLISSNIGGGVDQVS